MPRIIAGTAKKMILRTPAANKVRPTTDRIKETIFNIIASSIPGSYFLDLFSGTGQMGLEALSRGAANCVFVEKNNEAFTVLCGNIGKTGFLNCEAKRCDAMTFLEKYSGSFDLIYVDPPYDSGIYDKILLKISEKGILKSDTKIIIEHDLNVEINDYYGILDKYREETYGRTVVTFMRRRE